MKVTSEQIIVSDYRGYGELVIPKGTEVTNLTASGHDENYNFINDFSFIPPYSDGTKQSGLIHDLTYYGYNVDKSLVEEVLDSIIYDF